MAISFACHFIFVVSFVFLYLFCTWTAWLSLPTSLIRSLKHAILFYPSGWLWFDHLPIVSIPPMPSSCFTNHRFFSGLSLSSTLIWTYISQHHVLIAFLTLNLRSCLDWFLLTILHSPFSGAQSTNTETQTSLYQTYMDRLKWMSVNVIAFRAERNNNWKQTKSKKRKEKWKLLHGSDLDSFRWWKAKYTNHDFATFFL